jgi:hypothetical protein
MRSTGTTLATVASSSSYNQHDAHEGHILTGDFDGDSRMELMNYGYNCYDGTGATSRSWHLYKNTHLNSSSGMVTTITDKSDLRLAPRLRNSMVNVCQRVGICGVPTGIVWSVILDFVYEKIRYFCRHGVRSEEYTPLIFSKI